MNTKQQRKRSMKKKKPFDWLARLSQLAKAKTNNFEPRDFLELRHKASSWPTCAVGQLCWSLPREDGGGPYDYRLFSLGVGFDAAVRMCQWRDALCIFREIEKRSTMLLKELARLGRQAAGAGGRI